MQTPAFRSAAPASWFLSRRLFLAGVALVYAIAFWSLRGQVLGLFGEQGIVPLGERMEWLAPRVVGSDRLQFPTLLWFGASDAWLVGLCTAGIAISVVALLGILPRVSFALLWLLYLSFVVVGEPFLSFQWDVLLLEAGFFAAFFAPGGLRPFGRGERPPSRVVRWLLYWLLFRLMVLSGGVKLAYGDTCWLDGTALDYHYWTQPLPHRWSHYAHWMPEGFKQASLLVMFVIELGLPWLLFVPFGRRRLRQLVAAGVVFLMAMISATGNYGFFNLLTAVLCIPLLDDATWSALLRRKLPAAVPVAANPERWRRGLVAALALAVVALGTGRALQELRWIRRLPAPLAWLDLRARPLVICNGFGLFRVMTRERPELAIEGSRDGQEWKPYGFRYKPVDARRAPVFAGLHMPRLDWQLWFAALEYRGEERSDWTWAFLERLAEGSAPVLALCGENPFPEEPPRFVRARVALYEFSSPAERAAGTWWRHGEFRPFLPPVSGSGR